MILAVKPSPNPAVFQNEIGFIGESYGNRGWVGLFINVYNVTEEPTSNLGYTSHYQHQSAHFVLIW